MLIERCDRLTAVYRTSLGVGGSVFRVCGSVLSLALGHGMCNGVCYSNLFETENRGGTCSQNHRNLKVRVH